MSIVLENNRMDHQACSGFLGRSKILPSILDAGDRTVMRMVVHEERENGLSLDQQQRQQQRQSSSSSSSSIGVNSDDDNNDDVEERENNYTEEEEEVESKLMIKNTLSSSSPFDSAVDALEEALPLRRGISKFYNGKSKSFASLAEAACSSSVKEITKPENAYSRKRKNLLAYSLLYDKGRSPMLNSPGTLGTRGGMVRKPTNSSRNSLAFTAAMNNCENGENSSSRDDSRSPSVSPPQSPLPPPPWRSFSLVDLQHCAVSASTLNSNLSSPLMGKRTKHDGVSLGKRTKHYGVS